MGLLDPRLGGITPMAIEIYMTETNGPRPFVDPSQLASTSRASQGSPYLVPRQPESYGRSTSPLSWAYSSPMGSDAVIDASQGPTTPGDSSYYLSPRPAHVPVQENPTQDLLGLGIPGETDRGQQSQLYPILPESSYPGNLLDLERPPLDLGTPHSPAPPSTVNPEICIRRTKRKNSIKTSPAKRPCPPPGSLPERPEHSTLARDAGHTTNTAVRCKYCSSVYTDKAKLEEHIRVGHSRPFICVFHFAGCQSSFTSKNEWKRHVNSQHIQPIYYLCLHEGCADIPRTGVPRSSMEPQQGKSFNRKDLYDQHVKRMHTPLELKQAMTPEWKERTGILRRQAMRQRCILPSHMTCPAAKCPLQFSGNKAWDERMEHVARHMEKAAAGEEPAKCFGFKPDQSLVDWAEMPGVDVIRRTPTGWELCTPARRRASPYETSQENSQETDSNEDAEGDEC